MYLRYAELLLLLDDNILMALMMEGWLGIFKYDSQLIIDGIFWGFVC